jgi:CrcB protein
VTALWVALLGALGSLCRYGTGQLGARLLGPDVPAGTYAVNVLGSLAIGFVMSAFAARGALQSPARVALTGGFLGGFTTYSAFCFESFSFLDRGAYLAAAIYVVATLVGCLAGCAVGFALGRLVGA